LEEKKKIEKETVNLTLTSELITQDLV